MNVILCASAISMSFVSLLRICSTFQMFPVILFISSFDPNNGKLQHRSLKWCFAIICFGILMLFLVSPLVLASHFSLSLWLLSLIRLGNWELYSSHMHAAKHPYHSISSFGPQIVIKHFGNECFETEMNIRLRETSNILYLVCVSAMSTS